MYKVTTNGVKRLADSAYIPNDPANTDWMEYQKWRAAGNTPLPADPLPVVVDRTTILRTKLDELKGRAQSPTALAELIGILKDYVS